MILSGIDLCDPANCNMAISEIIKRFGRLDGLVNIAGGFRWELIASGDIETWDALYRINLRTTLAITTAALPVIASPGGAIVNIGALASNKAGSGMGAYAASKSGVARLTESLAEELKDKRIRVNAVSPSIIDTPANRAEMPDAEYDRWVSTKSLANVIEFLLSSRSEAITGALIPVAGRL
jgi:NAD(P)-dependent dehydrogenase (short-subunit alcohol dehydrogenase family)